MYVNIVTESSNKQNSHFYAAEIFTSIARSRMHSFAYELGLVCLWPPLRTDWLAELCGGCDADYPTVYRYHLYEWHCRQMVTFYILMKYHRILCKYSSIRMARHHPELLKTVQVNTSIRSTTRGPIKIGQQPSGCGSEWQHKLFDDGERGERER